MELVKGYAQHERALLESIASLRSKGLREMGVAQMGEVSAEMSKSINALFAVSENYPELKADESFAKLPPRPCPCHYDHFFRLFAENEKNT